MQKKNLINLNLLFLKPKINFFLIKFNLKWLKFKVTLFIANQISILNYFIYFNNSFNKIYCSILLKKKQFVKFKGYQYLFPYWNQMLIKGNLIKLKKNLFNNSIIVLNIIEGFNIKRFILLYSPLFDFVVNQKIKQIWKKKMKLKRFLINFSLNEKFTYFKKLC